MSMWNYLGAYVLGGVTLLPGVILIGYYFAPHAQPIVLKDTLPEPEEQYSDQLLSPVQTATYFYLSPYFVNLGEQDDEFVLSQVKARQQLRNSLDPATGVKTSLAKIPKYYGAVRGAVLQIWADDTCAKLISSIKLKDFVVTLWPRGAEDFELFYKKFPIVLISKLSPDGLVSLDLHPNEPPPNAHYIYVDNPCAKEDLYFALISGTRTEASTNSMGPRDPRTMAKPIDLDQEDVHELLNRIYSSNEGPHTQWINALLGRIFLAVKFSRQLDDYVKHKIVYKLTKVKPGFISGIEVHDVHVGSSLPYFNDIHLKSFAVDGNMTLEGNIVYTGGFSLNVVFTCSIKVPGLSRRDFKCVLAVKLESLKGTLVVRVKPPPSSHIWYGFKEMPQMELKIEPTVANRQVSYSFVTNALNSMICDAVKESMVLPYMDDIPFCDTSDEFYRGGIWDASQRPTNVSWTAQEKREARASFDSDHEVTFKDDASSIASSKSAQSTATEDTLHSGVASAGVAGPASESSTPKPIAKFWNNFMRRKASSDDLGMDQAVSSGSTTSGRSDLGSGTTRSTATNVTTGATPSPPVEVSRAPASSGASATTAMTPASVHGVQNKMFMPPETFASRKPVPASVTVTNADFDPVKEPRDYGRDPQDVTDRKVPRKPVGTGTTGDEGEPHRALRASRSLQQLNRVVSRSSQGGRHSPTSSINAARRGHSPSSSISSRVSTASRVSNASNRRTVKLENLDPEPEPKLI